MYIIKTEHSFDSAHFLANYSGKCSNIHGHRWRVVVEIMNDNLQTNLQSMGMLVDFSELKMHLKEEVDFLDHALIIEKGTLKNKTIDALKEENFRIIEVVFRPTAENFSKYFYDKMTEKGYRVKSSTVYETPNNSATYE